MSHVAVRTDLFLRDPDKVPLTDFFGGVRNVELSTEILELSSEGNVESDANKICRFGVVSITDSLLGTLIHCLVG